MPFGLTIRKAKGQQRSNMLFIITSDGRGIEKEAPVLTGCAVIDEFSAGYLLDGPNQYQSEATGDWTQLVDEKSTIPYCLIDPTRMNLLINQADSLKEDKKDKNKNKMTSLIDGIFHESWTKDLANLDTEQTKKARNEKMAMALIISVCVAGAAIVSRIFF